MYPYQDENNQANGIDLKKWIAYGGSAYLAVGLVITISIFAVLFYLIFTQHRHFDERWNRFEASFQKENEEFHKDMQATAIRTSQSWNAFNDTYAKDVERMDRLSAEREASRNAPINSNADIHPQNDTYKQ